MAKRAALRLRTFRRSQTYKFLRTLLLLTLVYTLIDVLHVRKAWTAEQEEAPLLGRERIYIASMLWMDEAVIRSHYGDALIAIAEEIGRANVFVSIHESGSWDDTKGALQLLESKLTSIGVRSKFVLDPTTHTDEIMKEPAETGWIRTPRKQLERRRIPYLADLRNLVMQPLYEMEKKGEKFDKILFLNDVVFNSDDVRTLLATRGGDYAAACSLDFKHPPVLYDTMALRDSEGHDPLSQRWPFFRSRNSRRAMKAGDPVPVDSCWNGIVVMDAAPFYADKPLAFRGIPDSLAASHNEGSECCLIHADNPLARSRGVWVNPRVRVSYDTEAYGKISPTPPWLSMWQSVTGTWSNRILRWSTSPWFKQQVIKRRVRSWQRTAPLEHREVGTVCLINEMQVLSPIGWQHV
ncbi:cryptococcal mannosyltransferase 1-domain-containing protein [Neohortaea acidophila]|uniref:Cryptococcal mannosyltransferase 1-domain-containing protein n=1 Tax=Neohortaea acidophila TaxID=245834 RepID=A0A6A6PFZ2_9PEZI|nr:cryptococcal mannosyltransferase 1-domain-containing protein [Neohortaea acidophila]KAF2478553.1 cryptococcal mannosyltransferase 1-domain-containing protein [Neohortaea acidophila]